MATQQGNEIQDLQRTALENLWVYLREPSDMAEKGEPQIFVEGKGCQVTDAAGNTYIDGMSGLWLKNVGYGQKEIADAAYEQMLKLTYMPMGTTTEPTVMLSEKVASLMPGDLSRCFFTSGGSESVETALKLTRAYFKRIGEPQRTKFISRKDSYHGATMGALALGGNFLYPKDDYEPLMPNSFHAAQPNFYRCEFNSSTPEECGQRSVDSIENIIRFQGPETIAAVVAEPVSSPMGAVVPPDNYWPLLRELCDKYGILLIADEVITGFGRTGKWFGCEHWGITPDMMTVARGITSGYIPMGGTILRKPIADAFVGSPRAAFRHVITFGGHPVAAAASLKNLEIMEREGMIENSERMGKYLLDGLEELKDKHPIIGHVRGLGLMCGLDLVKDRETKEHFPSDANLGPRLTQGFADKGLFLRGGDVVNVMPPLCVTSGEIEQIVATIDEVVGQVAADLGTE